MKKIVIQLSLALSLNVVYGQSSVDEFDAQFLNWYNKDFKSTGVLGTSVDKAYDLIKESPKEGKTVVVAVIDGGVDTSHKDLQGKIWINDDEIPGNGVDDDNNGYIDDIHGWNFIGNASGENINHENLEFTRIVRENNSDNPNLAAAQKMYNKELSRQKEEQKNIEQFKEIYYGAKSIIEASTGITVASKEDLDKVNSTNQQVLAAKAFLKERYDTGFTEEALISYVEHSEDYINYYLNLDFKPRKIAGDNPKDINDRSYGNPDVKGPRSNHGTSVSGVIAANRGNGIGIEGIATNVKIMCLRSTPNGDERDKDVALCVYYAVDNGADIINMSFGKDFSPEKKFVDDAVRYAEEKGVLIVHASGNDGNNIDMVDSYPSDRYIDNVEATNWLNVGASAMTADEEVAAIFSNYGKKHVDLFAPGVDVLSTDSASTYSLNNGTSLAAPIVSGVAALVLSYYPKLEPEELIDILMKSSYKLKKPKKILMPSLEDEKRKKTKFSSLSKSGGIVNAYDALKEAEKRSK